MHHEAGNSDRRKKGECSNTGENGNGKDRHSPKVADSSLSVTVYACRCLLMIGLIRSSKMWHVQQREPLSITMRAAFAVDERDSPERDRRRSRGADRDAQAARRAGVSAADVARVPAR